jgi:hypothetical protein
VPFTATTFISSNCTEQELPAIPVIGNSLQGEINKMQMSDSFLQPLSWLVTLFLVALKASSLGVTFL